MTITVSGQDGQELGTVQQDGQSWHARDVRGFTRGWASTMQGAVLLLARRVITPGAGIDASQYLTPPRQGCWGLGSVT